MILFWIFLGLVAAAIPSLALFVLFPYGMPDPQAEPRCTCDVNGFDHCPIMCGLKRRYRNDQN